MFYGFAKKKHIISYLDQVLTISLLVFILLVWSGLYKDENIWLLVVHRVADSWFSSMKISWCCFDGFDLHFPSLRVCFFPISACLDIICKFFVWGRGFSFVVGTLNTYFVS